MKIVTQLKMRGGKASAARFAGLLAMLGGHDFALGIPSGHEPEELHEVVRDLIGIEPDDITMVDSSTVMGLSGGNEIVFVTGETLAIARTQAPQGASILCTHGEDGHRTFGGSEFAVAVPFGDGDSALESMRLALSLTEPLRGGKIVLMHTTYLKAGCTSQDPRAHMNEGARRIEARLIEEAERVGVPCETHIGMHDSLVGFVLETAVHTGCYIIVTAPDGALHGSYADQIEQHAHLPVLVAAREKRS